MSKTDLFTEKSILMNCDSSKYDEFKLDYHFFLEKIVTQARAIQELRGVELVVIVKNELVKFTDISLRSWFDRIVVRTEEEMLRALRRESGFNFRGINSFQEFIASGSLSYPQKLTKAVRLKAWNKAKGHLFEWAILAALIKGYGGEANRGAIETRMGSNKDPILVKLGNERRYLWYQRNFKASCSGLSVCPDFVFTNTPYRPTEQSIIGFIECKCTANIRAKVIREIFGTAYDIGASFALLATYEEVSKQRRDSAKKLGVTIMVNPLRGLDRKGYLERKVDFFEEIRSKVEQADNDKPFYNNEIIRRERIDLKGR